MLGTSLLAACAPETFGAISLFGAQIESIHASLTVNFSAIGPDIFRFTQPTAELHNATFCNVTISYTHPGQNDNIIVEAWLPVENWNNRLQAVGGGAFAAGRFFISYGTMYGALADGYATITTDAGHEATEDPTDARPWALLSPGNVNLYNLQNLASVSLDDEAKLAKSIIKSFYGKPPDYSYWNGCSQGGRQGLMLAQRYPTAYDGIMAGAPVVYWTEVVPSFHWPQQVMDMMGKYPRGCEIDAIVAGALSACDGLDGVVDGIISKSTNCLRHFDPFALVGHSFHCPQTNRTMRITKAAAVVVNATWQGMTTEQGERVWYGLLPPADLTGNNPASYGFPGVAMTNCTAGGTCRGQPINLGLQWLQLFVAKDPTLDLSKLTHAEFDTLVHRSGQEYRSMISTDDPDLARFRDAGGKIITFHGLADAYIPPAGSEKYYNAVKAQDARVREYMRHFEIPGLGHCFGGSSGQPTHLFSQLRAWVENGTAPEQSPITIRDLNGKGQDRIICAYPKEPRFHHGGSWYCG